MKKSEKWVGPLLMVLIPIPWAIYLEVFAYPVKFLSGEMWTIPLIIILGLVILQMVMNREIFPLFGMNCEKGFRGFSEILQSLIPLVVATFLLWLIVFSQTKISYSFITYVVFFLVLIFGYKLFGDPKYSLKCNPPNAFDLKILKSKERASTIGWVSMKIIEMFQNKKIPWEKFLFENIQCQINETFDAELTISVLKRMVNKKLLKKVGGGYQVTPAFIKEFYYARK